MTRVQEIDLQQMAPLRNVSQKISEHLQQTLNEYLGVLAPLIAPHKVLGEYMEGFTRERVAGAEKNFSLLEQRYLKLCRETFKLPAKLSTPVPAIKKKLRIYPWEYLYKIGDDTITISSPVKWVLSYDHSYDLSSLLQARLAGEKFQAEESKQLIINTLTAWMMMERQKGIKRILEDLRFEVTTETSEVSADLPYVVIQSKIESFRPQDDLILMVSQLSGKAVFEELIDTEAIKNIPDPVADRLMSLVAG